MWSGSHQRAGARGRRATVADRPLDRSAIVVIVSPAPPDRPGAPVRETADRTGAGAAPVRARPGGVGARGRAGTVGLDTLGPVDAGTLRNVARNALRPSYLPVMARKVAARLRPAHRDEALRWAAEAAEPVAGFATAPDPGSGSRRGLGGRLRAPRPARREPGVTGGGAGTTSSSTSWCACCARRRCRDRTRVDLRVLVAPRRWWVSGRRLPYFRLGPEQYVGHRSTTAARGLAPGLRGTAPTSPVPPQIDRIDLFTDPTRHGGPRSRWTRSRRSSPDAVVVMDDMTTRTSRLGDARRLPAARRGARRQVRGPFAHSPPAPSTFLRL
jgi:hypothetical protein